MSQHYFDVSYIVYCFIVYLRLLKFKNADTKLHIGKISNSLLLLIDKINSPTIEKIKRVPLYKLRNISDTYYLNETW